jgi:hypothetical protein
MLTELRNEKGSLRGIAKPGCLVVYVCRGNGVHYPKKPVLNRRKSPTVNPQGWYMYYCRHLLDVQRHHEYNANFRDAKRGISTMVCIIYFLITNIIRKQIAQVKSFE